MAVPKTTETKCREGSVQATHVSGGSWGVSGVSGSWLNFARLFSAKLTRAH